MSHHHFIFQPGEWLGQGKLTFSSSAQIIRFYTKWSIKKSEQEGIFCEQQVEKEGGEDKVCNHFLFYNITPTQFSLEITNDLIGKGKGKGIIDKTTVAWEFREQISANPDDYFEGFEVYTLQEDGDYLVHAEYSSADQFRTIIDGRIWKKSIYLRNSHEISP